MKTLLKRISATLVIVVAFTLVAVPMVSAQNTTDPFGVNAADTTGLGNQDLMETINGIIQVILGFLGILAVIIILWGGFIWMTAMGDEGKVDTAKKLIVSGIVGIIIILSAYAIAQFVVNTGVNVTN